MGLGKKLKKAVKKVSRSVETAVKAPVKTLEKVAKGDFDDAVKELGKGVGGSLNAATFGAFGSGDVQKLFRNDVLNTLTFNTGKELANYGKGLNELQKTGEADKRFWQSTLALGAKAAGGAYLAQTGALKTTLTAKNFGKAQLIKNLVGSGDIAGAGAVIAGDGEVGNFLGQVSDSVRSRMPASAPQEYASDGGGYYAEPAQDSGIGQIAIWSALAVGAVFILKKGMS